MGGGGKSGNSQKSKNYFGTIAGVVCAGPVDELVALVIDGATIWPTNAQWNDGIVDLPAISLQRKSNVATLAFGTPHGLTKSDKFTTQFFSDASFNVGSPASPINISAYKFSFANTGPDVALTALVAEGSVFKVKHYVAGALVNWAGGVWQAATTHDATAATVPPNATYWNSYSVKRGTSPNPVPITVTGYGNAYFYWGDTSQSYSAYLPPRHPGYRRQAYIVLKDFLFGTERQGPPNIELVVRRAPQQTIAGSYNVLDADSQANPKAIEADLATDPVFGLGLDPAIYDSTSLIAVAGDLQAAAAQTYLSPALDRAQPFRAFLAQLLAYYDGWIRFTAAALIESGRFLHNEAPPSFTDATTIDFNDLIGEIQWDAEGWPATFNETVVKFQDMARAYKDAAQMSSSGFNREVTGIPLRATLDRQFITRQAQAAAHAAEWGKINAQPKLSGSLSVRAEKAASIRQGDLFKLTHDALSLSIVCRCTQKMIAAPPAGRVTLKFENERGVAAIPYAPTVAGPAGPVAPGLEQISLYQFLQPPPQLSGDEAEFQLAVLIARTSELTRGVQVWLRYQDPSLFATLGLQREFAIVGTLTQDYGIPAVKSTEQRSRTSNVATLKITAHGYATGMHFSVTNMSDSSYNTPDELITVIDADHILYASPGSNEAVTADTNGVVAPLALDQSNTLRMEVPDFTVQEDLDRLAVSQTQDDADNGTTLAVLVRAADGAIEVMTMYDIALISGEYRLSVKRAQFSDKFAFVTGDSLWLIKKSEMVSYGHGTFAQAVANADTVTMRLQSFTADQEADLSDANICPDINFTFADPWAPSVEWVEIESRIPGAADFSDILDFTTAFSLDTTYRITFNARSPVSLLSTVKLLARQGTTEQIIYAGSFPATPATRSFLKTAVFKLQYEGPWEIIALVVDWARRAIEVPLTAIGGGSEVEIIANAPAGTCAVPTSSKISGFYNHSPLACVLNSATAGSTIHYRTAYVPNQLFASAVWSAWATVATGSTVNVTLVGGDIFDTTYNYLEIYASKVGLNDSVHAKYKYEH